MAFCPNCGNELKGTPNYCPNCGQKLSDYKFETVNPNMSSNQPQSAAYTPAPAQAPQQIKVQKPAHRFDPDEDDDRSKRARTTHPCFFTHTKHVIL